METSLLQDFLSLRLLNIGADDSRLEKLGATCGELANKYAAEPQAALAPLLAAWDPSCADDPSLLSIGVTLQKHWPTFRGAFPDEPLTLYRAVVLEAVMRAMEQQGTLAVAVDLVAANVLPHLQVGQEARILSKLVERAGAITAERLAKSWPQQGAEAAEITPLQMPKMVALKELDATAWFAQVASASGPSSNKAGVTLTAPNPTWTNSAGQWSYEFADRMAPILADVHNKAAAAALRASSQGLKALGDAVSTKVYGFLAQEQARSIQREAAGRLLWWRQALYSESAGKPYRKLDAPLVALHMALDMSELLPEVYPPAVESLLFEAVRAVTDARNEVELAMSELLEVQFQSTELANLEWLKQQQTGASRTLLVQALANSHAAGKSELQKLGINADTKMVPGDWAIWLLREVKAIDALASPDELEPAQEQA